MSEKPDWNDAPEWANWLAQGAGGSWFWYEVEPEEDDDDSSWVCPGHTKCARCGGGKVGPKEPRPKPKGQSISIPRGESLELRLAGSIPLQVYYGPLTVNIRIREDNV